MTRVHLLEFADQPWCPATLRDAGTDYLRVVSGWFGAHRALAPLVTEAVASWPARSFDPSGRAGLR